MPLHISTHHYVVLYAPACCHIPLCAMSYFVPQHVPRCPLCTTICYYMPLCDTMRPYVLLHTPTCNYVPLCATTCYYVPLCDTTCPYVSLHAFMCHCVPLCALHASVWHHMPLYAFMCHCVPLNSFSYCNIPQPILNAKFQPITTHKNLT